MSNVVSMGLTPEGEDAREWFLAVRTSACMFLPDKGMAYACADAGVQMGVISLCDAKEIKEYIDHQLEGEEPRDGGEGTG